MRPTTSAPPAMRPSLRLVTLAAAVLCTALVSTNAHAPVVGPVRSDTVQAELRVGRYWHAARLLREAGAAEGAPADVLLLADAEAGWGNWPAVAELLAGREWLDAERRGHGWYMLGRAHEAEGQWAAAAEAYGRFLATGFPGRERVAAAVRRARAFDRIGSSSDALSALDEVDDALVLSWAALELAPGAVASGDTARTIALLARTDRGVHAERATRLEVDARLAAGDTARAVEALRASLNVRPERARAERRVELGLLLLASGDGPGAEPLLLSGFEEARRDPAAAAAGGLIDLSEAWDLDFTLRLARAADRAGDGRRALIAYDRAARMATEAGDSLSHGDRLGRARLLATVRPRQTEALAEFRAIREHVTDDRVAVRNLEVWTAMRRRQRMSPQVETLRRWLLEEHPGSGPAAELMWSRASAAESRGDDVGALEHYEAIATHAGSHNRAGLARMRMGQIHLGRGDLADAARVFEAYLRDFPRGRRWADAAYWSARVHLELGDTARATDRVALIHRGDPLSYYAVMGDELLGREFRVELPLGEAPVEPTWLTEGLETLDLLIAAGLEEGANAEIEALEAKATGSEGAMLRLAEGLIERGRTLAGIQVGWQLVADGRAWDRRLVEVVYPFPYRELVEREAAEWGVDPIVVAAMIRQESAFEAAIVSHAGAVGLMQVMPATGTDLARTHGVHGFRESSLRIADVNIHLGAAYFVEMSRRFSDDLPLVLTAYNAGPTRARRWARLPEAGDPERFTEIIPIVETQGYVKSVRRNMALYRALYGDG